MTTCDHGGHRPCDHDHTRPPDVEHGRSSDAEHGRAALTRRTVLGATAAGVAGLAGCLGSGEESTPTEPPDPVALDGSKACDACGMIIAEGYGPNGQTYFQGDYPRDRDGPAWYDSVRELYVDRFGRADRGTDAVATYVTDYATFDYEVEARNGDRFVTGSVDPGTFVRAAEAVFVVDSGVQGAMGPDLLPFGERAAAEAFVDGEGGEIVAAGDVTPDLVSSI